MITNHELGDTCSGTAFEASRLRIAAGVGAAAEFEVVHVHEEGQCLPLFQTFNQDACACFSAYQCDIECSFNFDTPYLNPLEVCECISEEDYLSIYQHGFGPDCIPDGDDCITDDEDEEPIDIDPDYHVDSQEACDLLGINPNVE